MDTLGVAVVGVPKSTYQDKRAKFNDADPNGWYVIGGGLSNLKGITDALLTAMK